MSMSVSEFRHRVREWGPQPVDGYPADGVDGLDLALVL